MASGAKDDESEVHHKQDCLILLGPIRRAAMGTGFLFGFLKTSRRAGRTRRHDRLRWQTVKRATVIGSVLIVLASCGFMVSSHPAAVELREQTSAQFQHTGVTLGFAVNEILVMGRKEISEDELLSHLGIRAGTPIFAVDLEGAQQLLHQISWVEDVRVSRRLPDKIIVTLNEREPAALWQYQKKISLIDSKGVVIRDHDLEAYAHLPLVVGEDAPLHVDELVRLMMAEPALADMMASAIRVGKRRWDLRLKNGVTIRLPENNVELALSRLIHSAREDGLLDKDISVIDLRLPEKLTVTPKATAAATSAAATKKNI